MVTSLVPLINLDVDSSPLDGQDPTTSNQCDTLSLSVTKVSTFPFVSQSKMTPHVTRKLFDPMMLQSAINVLSTKSWLDDTIGKKKRRCEESTPSKGLIVKVTASQPTSKKMKKQKTMAALAIDPTFGHLLLEITQPQKEGNIDELAPSDFHIRIVDMGILVHDSMVSIQRSTNARIEDKLEELRKEKEALKASNKELMNCMKVVLGSTSSSSFDPSAEDNKNFLLKLQQERYYGQIGHAQIEEIKSRGPPLIENIQNLLLDTEKLRGCIKA